MRIISPFKDYYDCGMQYGYDPNIIYAREIFSEELNITLSNMTNSYGWFRHCLGFAGKIYDVYVTFHDGVKYSFNLPNPTTHKHIYWGSKSSDCLLGLFEKTPIFYVSKGELFPHNKWCVTYNVMLRKFNFQSILDPIQAYQTLSMYFGQHIAEKDVPKIDDKTLAEAKGFDKNSFRKEKQ